MSKKFIIFLIFLTFFVPLFLNFRPVAADVITIRPNLPPGDSTQLTPNTGVNWDAVDEDPTDGDATFVRSSITDDSPYDDLYNLPDNVIPVGATINSVTVYINVRSTNSTYRASFLPLLKNVNKGGSVQYGASGGPLTTYVLYSSSFGGITQGDLNALQIGVEIASGLHAPTYYPGRATQVYAVINYTINPPTVSTSAATSITSSGATLNGNITATGGQKADLRGFDIGTAPGNYNLAECSQGTSGNYQYDTGIFTCSKSGLSGHTTYYFRAKAHNSAGWSYGSELNFATLNTAPAISSVSDTPDPQAGGLNISFTSIASDPNGDTIKLFICKDLPCTNCAPGNTSNCWSVTGVGIPNNPSASYSCPSCLVSTNNYWAKVCDALNVCSSVIVGGSFRCLKQYGCAETDPTKCYPGSPSSYVADGVCCNLACTGTCERCDSTPGTCSPRNNDDKCSMCKYCPAGATGNCLPIADSSNGKDCNESCTKCFIGNCVTRAANDVVECPACFRCDGTNTDCQKMIGGLYTVPFPLDTQGNFFIRYLSLDKVGNQDAEPQWKKVKIVENNIPQAINLTADESSSLCCGKTYPPVILNWEYSDPDNDPVGTDPQTYYRVEIVEVATGNVVIRSCDSDLANPNARCQTSSNEVNFGFSPSPIAGYATLSFDTEYSWRVKVWDTKGPEAESDWSSGTFHTILHPFPLADFDWYPQHPAKDEVVKLCAVFEEACITPCEAGHCLCGMEPEPVCENTAPSYENRSICYRGVGNTDYNYCDKPGYGKLGGAFSWTITPAIDATFLNSSATSSNPNIKISGTDISLEVTDAVDYSCIINKTITSALPLPKWKEIAPF